MKDTGKARALLDRYLSEVRAGLRGLPAEQVDEILRELRSHVEERAEERGGGEESMRASIAALGEPEQIAGQYLTQSLFSRTAATRSPVLMAQSLFHWATLSLQGFAVAFVSLLLYFIGGSCLLMALLKPFRPDRVGVWKAPAGTPGGHGLQLMLHGAPPAGEDLLGWWIVPLGLLLGLSIIVVTYRLDLLAIRNLRRRGPILP